MLKTITAEIEGLQITLREAPVGKMMPLFTALQDPEQATLAQMKIMAECVLGKDGNPVGMGYIEAMGLTEYMALVPHVLEVNGLKDMGEDQPAEI